MCSYTPAMVRYHTFQTKPRICVLKKWKTAMLQYTKVYFFLSWRQNIIEPNINVFCTTKQFLYENRQFHEEFLSLITASLFNHAFLWSTKCWHRRCHGSQSAGMLPQILVSWCHRLEGRILSTFSITKFKGAKRVLRNCKEIRYTFRSKSRTQYISRESCLINKIFLLCSSVKSSSMTKMT